MKNKFEEKIAKYLAEAKRLKMDIDEAQLRQVTRDLGPSIYQRDAELVACSDPEELERIKKNFLMGKLGMKDDAQMDAVLKNVCDGYEGKVKFRSLFYIKLTTYLENNKNNI